MARTTEPIGPAMPARFAGSARAGPLLLTSGVTGRLDPNAGDENAGGLASASAYAEIEAILADAGLDAGRVMRLDHFTSGQGWLAERQKARAAVFGKPARLASTGIATWQEPQTLLGVSAMALADAGDIALVAPGADFAMPAIAAAVSAGAFLFISGVLTDGTGDAAQQCDDCLVTIERLLAMGGTGPRALLRLDVFAANQLERLAIVAAMRARWPGHAFIVGGGDGQFDHPGQIEINALALLAGEAKGTGGEVRGGGIALAGPWPFDGGIRNAAAARAIVARIEMSLAALNLPAAALARIEVRMPPEPGLSAGIRAALAEALTPEMRPALVLWHAPGPLTVMATFDDQAA